jgi:uncharacterized protein (TIGR03089 family)
VSELITGRLRRWIRDRGSEPLITYYDLVSGERTELSGVSFANWVDKTSNLLVDELMVEPADQVELSLAATHPGHWVTLVWELACWQVGAVVTLGQPSSAQVLAAGPEPSGISDQNVQLVICSLHPLGLGLPTPPTGGALDYALEVRGQPDQHAALPQSGLALAWRDQERQLTQAELVDRPAPPARRRLIRPSRPWATTRAALLDPLLGGGSSVIVVGPTDAAALGRIAAQERAEISG